MNKHCTAESTKPCECTTCGLVQDGEPKPCGIADSYDDDRFSWGDLYDKLLCLALGAVASYGFGIAAGIW